MHLKRTLARNALRELFTPTVKTKRSELSEVSLWNAIHSVLAFGPRRETFSSGKTQWSPHCCCRRAKFEGGAIPIESSQPTLSKARLLESSGGNGRMQYANVWWRASDWNFPRRYLAPFHEGLLHFCSEREKLAECWDSGSWTAFISFLTLPFRPLKRAAEAGHSRRVASSPAAPGSRKRLMSEPTKVTA